MTPTTPSLASTPSQLGVEASPHEVLLFHPNMEISFPITSVMKTVNASPVRGSSANVFPEISVKIGAAGRDSYIRAAEMTPNMQLTLRKLSVEEIQANYRVTRSDEVGSKGLYALTRPPVTNKQLPKIPNITPMLGMSSVPKTPKNTATPRSLLAYLTPKSATWSNSWSSSSFKSDSDGADAQSPTTTSFD
ncbi:MAG: hypothetical protein CYPHOPRED_002031 [Cyphobasidiales sp. Tagirdzhanova-0007]|nr:MAG: hypothetical protein CYPHOPRED_002031 [Cyphobasidiales sp. Tagirdzhanova-0007]